MPQPRKPTALKKVTGNPGKRALPKNEPQPDLGNAVPDAPGHLNEDGRAEWARLARRLWLNACLGAEDVQMFAVYCEHYANAMKYRRLIEAQVEEERTATAEKPAKTAAMASMIETTNGNWVQNPLVGMLNVSLREMFKAGTAFGLTPADRSRIDIPRTPAGGGGPVDKPTGPEKKRPADFLNRGPRLAVSNP